MIKENLKGFIANLHNTDGLCIMKIIRLENLIRGNKRDEFSDCMKCMGIDFDCDKYTSRRIIYNDNLSYRKPRVSDEVKY